MQCPPIPPFTRDTALAKVQAGVDAWNTGDPTSVIQSVSPDCVWRSRENSFKGRAAIEYFIKNKLEIESECRLTTELWAFTGNRISVRFECEWQHIDTGQWYRSHGNEHWEFESDGYMTRRDMSANDIAISAGERRIGL